MELPAGNPPCRVFLLGPMTVLDRTGAVRTPKGQKVQALLAMLALAPRGARSRVWLRDKLWSDREEEQAGANLRQALTELRRALGPVAQDILVADKNTVSLQMSSVWVDVRTLHEDAPSRLGPAGLRPSAELLEGLDLADPEFEEWLTLERRFWANRVEEIAQDAGAKAAAATAVAAATAAPPRRPRNGPAANGLGALSRSDRESPPPAPRDGLAARVAILPMMMVGATHMSIGDRVNELVAKALLETGEVGVTDCWSSFAPADGAAPETADGILAGTSFLFQCRLSSASGSEQVTLSVQRAADRVLIWVDSVRLPQNALRADDLTPLAPLIRRAVDGILRAISEDPFRNPDADAAGPAFVLAAVDRIFRLSEADLAAAERTLRRTIELSPSSQACAWLAFLITFRVGQRFSHNIMPLLEEAQVLGRQALALGPQNALTHALVGHVHSYLFGEYDVAAELFERSIEINPAQPLSWDLYAMLHAYIGRPEAGLRCAQWGRELGAFSPYRYYFDTSRCISAALAGRHAEAVRVGRMVLQERPDFNSILRFLVSSYAHLGDQASAQDALTRLRRLEPDFSIEALRDAQYPLLRSGGGATFVDGLIKAGVRRTIR